MIVIISIVISILIMIVMTKIIRKYFKSEDVRKKIISGESLLLSKERGSIRIAIGVGVYIVAMVVFSEVEYYEVLNILLATVLIDLVLEVNKGINSVDI